MKIKDIQLALNNQYAEREEVIEGLMVAMIARQHALLIGPPGTGKSALVSDLTKRITGANYFQWLLTRFSTPEELFGPVSLKDLEQGVYKRNTTGKLPEAHTSFLDEIFKANSAILNALLTLINERVFYNNGAPAQVPLMSLIGSSNEYPEEGEGLEALFDRFLLRYEVDYIGEDQSFISMLKGSAPSTADMSIDELFELQFFSDTVTIPDEVFDALSKIRRELMDEGIRPSDRRFKQVLAVIRAKAVLAGRDYAELEDLMILKHSLWEKPEQRDKVAKIVRNHAQDAVKTRVEEIKDEAADILNILEQSNNSTDMAVESTKKLKSLVNELKKLQKDNPNRPEVEQAIALVQKSLKDIASQVLGV
ncbi:ATPase family associated with various cellular activities (AAA) [Paenibacillus sp. oral taxon 786 str. D14]|uniref:AAA family ATPase n=1 Tax=Paenibacillus sp. oral taxon 786 TaxID=652715 RepID=UPI0001AFD482|nr:AAA family ATPase [Paenibacillus sp. oral taxon 786]EES72382.1 ATPase family associated with various cellular activities (AAA) [Paenibacillus sp. oral taxon 786 str. D14]